MNASTPDARGAGAAPTLRPGAHVVTPRRSYVHHGIYVGNGLVVHYAGFARGLRIGPVEAVSVEQFARGRSLSVVLERRPHFASAEIVRRALSRVGEDRYHLLKNNCEHFCEWCLRAEHRSYQVDRLRALPQRMKNRAIDVLAKLVAAPRAGRRDFAA